jgi:hypothetical protein
MCYGGGMISPFFQAKRRKFKNVPTAYGGRTYPSKAQARRAAELDLEVKAGLIRAWIPEVSIPLPPPFDGERMRLDALIINHDGTVRWEDVKGMEPTPTWKLRRKAVENGYGITIEVIRRTR